MDALQRAQALEEIEQLEGLLIAAEDWGKAYRKDPKTHKQIIQEEAKLRVIAKGIFGRYAEKVESYINWNAYTSNLKADVNVEVIVSEDLFTGIDQAFLELSFEVISTSIAIGAAAGETIYKVPLGIRSTDEIIQRLAIEQLAYLVGRKVDQNGNLVDNPKAEYRISDKTRRDLNQAIRTGISLGEDRNALTERLKKIVKNTRRAEIIAQTETVNAYGTGLLTFGEESGATGKESQDVSSKDVCRMYADEGIVPINYLYGDAHKAPAYHVGCRCGLRLVYENEFPAQKSLTKA